MFTLMIALVVAFFDQLTKWYVTDVMELGETIPIIPDMFHMTYIINPGAAFGLFPGARWIFLAVVLIVFFIFFVARKKIPKEPRYFSMGIGLLLGGSLGNAIDRIRIEGVVDFFDFRIWPIFNVADIAICLGIALICLYYWRREE